MRLALIVEYEGTFYHGFQYQVNASSIQGELEKAISRLTGEKVRVKGAGRTDSGVHAKGQVVAFDTSSTYEPYTVVKALNYYLPNEVAVRAGYRVHLSFDPRRDATGRTYKYTLHNSPTPSPLRRKTVCLVKRKLNVAKMNEAAQLFVGRHDFRNFSGSLTDGDVSTVRYIYEATVRRADDVITFDVEGSSFLPRQVRRMTGALVDIGKDELSMEDFRLLIDGRYTEAVAHSLPSKGLCLMKVTYDDFPPKGGESDDNE